MSSPIKKLSEVARINPRRPNLDRDDNTYTSFIPMKNVNDNSGIVEKLLDRPYAEVKNGYTYFEDDDVIFAKITPCMQNGKHAVVRGLLDGIGFGSTEFHVIRSSEEVIPEWIHFFLRRKETLDEAVKTFTGAVGQQRVPKSFLESLEIPTPKITEQRRIAARLKVQLAEVEKARKAAAVQAEDIQKLFPALLRELFSNLRNMNFIQIGDVTQIQLGKMLSPKSKTGKSPYPYLRNQNVQWGKIDLSDLAEMDFSEKEKEKFALRPGDLLVCEGGEPGRCAIWKSRRKNCFYQKALHRIRPLSNNLEPEYMMYWLWHQAFSGAFEDQNAKTTIAHLPVVRLSQLSIPLPGINDQRKIATKLRDELDTVRETERTITKSLKEISLLPSKILSHAFEMI